jgi:hypothetical protein
MVCPAISSYSFGATALIFCRMFIHIMEVCMTTGFWWSGGGIICVLQTHFIFFKSLLAKQLCPKLSSAGAYFFSSFIRQLGSVFNKIVKSIIYLLFSYQTGYIMWEYIYPKPGMSHYISCLIAEKHIILRI